MSPDLFFKTYAPIAVNDSLFSRIPPSIKLAQAALESGWGESGLSSNANNYFGIKSAGWDGATYNASTHEFYGGSNSPTTIQADFRRYGSVYESFNDHTNFLHKYSRYDKLFNLNPLDYKGWANGLQSAGYATSPTYASKLINLVEKYNLQQYDLKAANLRMLKTVAFVLFVAAIGFVAFFAIKSIFK